MQNDNDLTTTAAAASEDGCAPAPGSANHAKRPRAAMQNSVVRSGVGGVFSVELPNLGEGTMRTSATYIALLASLEGNRSDALAVLASAAENLGITGAEIEHRQKLDEVEGLADEQPMRDYEERADQLEEEARRRYPDVR